MVATYEIVTILLASLAGANAAGGLLPRQSSNQVVDTKAADTVRALDTNGNGKVDKSEIAVFAKSQGLSTEEVLADFQELDTNKDGELDSSEISGLLGDADASQSMPAHQEVGKAAPAADDLVLQKQIAGTAVKSGGEDDVVSRKQKAPLSVKSALRVQNDKDAKVVAAEVMPPVAAPALRSQSVKAVKANTAVTSLDAAEPPTAAVENMGLNLAALEHDAQEQAGNVMASRLAQRAQVLLARSLADEHKAEQFDAEVHTLRGNATALAQEVNQDTREAARKTVSDVAQKSLAELKRLQEQEQQAQIAADEHRRQAAKAMERVRKAQASLREDQ